MPRQIGKLSALTVSRLKEPGLYADGAGLYLRIAPRGGKFWVFRFMLHRRAREMGLGALHTFSLAEARQRATECRKLLAEGKDPIAVRDAAQAEARLAAARGRSFRECAEGYIVAHKDGWRNAKHASQWENTLATYVYPVFGDAPVQDVDVTLVLKVLEPIWKAKAETATRVRGRMEAVLDWAATREYRQGENPARWRGHLENLLPRRTKLQRVQHRPALSYDKIGDFMAQLQAQDGTAARAMAFVILTAARTSEAIGATWDEIDFAKKLWTVPANRIKAGREHRVPLSAAALRILSAVKAEQATIGSQSNWVFEGQKKGKPLSNMAMLALLKRMERQDITVHGFRSTFRDWAAEQTNFPREVAEAALAHISGDKVELAYRRSDLFDKRRQMMEAWARYCAIPLAAEKSGGKVVRLGR